MPAPKRNQFAAKPASLRKTGAVNLRATAAEIAAWRRAAGAGADRLTTWVRKTLNASV